MKKNETKWTNEMLRGKQGKRNNTEMPLRSGLNIVLCIRYVCDVYKVYIVVVWKK